MQRVSLRDQNLRTHDINSSHHFGDGVFHLNARIYFDEIKLLRIRVEQKLHRARIAVSRFTAMRTA